MSKNPENPYDRPGIIACSTDLLEEVHTSMLQTANALEQGNVSPLPDGILELLQNHTEALSFAGLGEVRKQIADQLGNPPFTPEVAKKVGGQLVRFVQACNTAAAHLNLAEDLNVINLKTDLARRFSDADK